MPPNTRVQRTRCRSPLTRKSLGGRRVFAVTVSVFVLAVSPSLLGSDGELALRLAGARRARIGHPVALTFTAVNAGRTSFYFMEPWWWDPKGLHIVATAADGSHTESTNVILDIDGRIPNGVSHAYEILSSYHAGETLKLHIMRQQKRLELAVEIPPAPAHAQDSRYEPRGRVLPGPTEL